MDVKILVVINRRKNRIQKSCQINREQVRKGKIATEDKAE